MKKILSVLCSTILCCGLFCGCGESSCTLNWGNSSISKQFVVLEEFDDVSGLCYDKDTKIIYIYSLSGAFNAWSTWSYTPYYVMDTNNNPTIAVYNGDEVDK